MKRRVIDPKASFVRSTFHIDMTAAEASAFDEKVKAQQVFKGRLIRDLINGWVNAPNGAKVIK